MTAVALVLIAYLIGSVSFAVVVSWCFGLPDPHSYGSGNPGATNVLRTGKKAAAVLTLFGDAAKGGLAYALASHFAPDFGLGAATLGAVALAAFLGHLFPVYFRFKGGKGVATAFGILLAMDWRLALAVLLVWVLTAIVTRYSSLAAVLAALFGAVAATWYLGWGPSSGAVWAMTALLIWRHRGNMQRLAAGTESRIRLSRGG